MQGECAQLNTEVVGAFKGFVEEGIKKLAEQKTRVTPDIDGRKFKRGGWWTKDARGRLVL